MSAVDLDIRTIPQRAKDWVRRRLVAVRRCTPAPLLIRVTAAVAGLVALVLALPLDSLDSGGLARAMVIALPAAACVGILPRTRWVTLYAVLVVLAWVLSSVGFGEPAGLGRVALLAASLYVMHRAATFAAVLPTDAVVAPRVLRNLIGQTVAVTAAGLTVGVGSLAAVRGLPEVQSAVGPIVGSFIAVGLVALLTWMLVRRR